jgi:hypothetical protein
MVLPGGLVAKEVLACLREVAVVSSEFKSEI